MTNYADTTAATETGYNDILTFSRVKLVRESSEGYDIEAGHPEAAYNAVRGLIEDEPSEVLISVALNAKNKILAVAEVGRGTADRAPAHCREVFRHAILSNATKIIVAHNHPSGDPEPSSADIHLTKKLIEAGDIIGIPVVDHIIIGLDRYTSLRECGHI